MQAHVLPHNDTGSIQKAIILSVLGNAAFSIQYALVQMLGAHIGTPLIAATNATILLGVVVLASILRGHRHYFITAYPKEQTFRCLLRVLANAASVWALVRIPLTTHIVIGFLSPLVVAMLSPLFLKEPRVQRAFVSVVLGLAGTFVILAIEHAPLVPVLVAIVGVAIGSMNGILVRTMPRDHPFTFMLYTNLFVAAAFWPFALDDLPNINWHILGLIVASGAAASFSNYTYFRANLLASPQYTSPLTYTQLLWGALIAWFLWHHVPDAAFWLGALLIIIGSIFLLPRPVKTTA